jgi:2'-5' RNA ligase
MKRLFIAIKINDSPEVKSMFEFIMKSLNSERIKWVELWNLHLTLIFLGDTEEEKIDEIKAAIDNLTTRFAQFQMTIKSAGVFKNFVTPTVIWLGIEPNQVLEEIKKGLDENLNKIGYSLDTKKFKPHLTIGRSKFIKDKSNLEDIIDNLQGKEISVQHVDKIILYESTLTQNGPIYKAVHTSQLQAG